MTRSANRISPFVSILILLAGIVKLSPLASAGGQANPGNGEKSIQAFRDVASVLTSPRCLNCHTSSNGPLQADDNHPHAMNVKRGADGKGFAALRCFACHQTENGKTPHSPPGAADWQLPPPKTPMAWPPAAPAGSHSPIPMRARREQRRRSAWCP